MTTSTTKGKPVTCDDGNRIAQFIVCREVSRAVIDALCDRPEVLKVIFSVDPRKIQLIDLEKLKGVLNPQDKPTIPIEAVGPLNR